MKRSLFLLTGFSLCAFIWLGATADKVQAHGGIGGFHAAGFHAGGAAGFHAGGVAGFHAGGVAGAGFHAGGVNHVGYYPHFNPAVGYYHPAARAAAWGAAYNRNFGYDDYNPYAYQQPNPYQAPSTGASPTASGSGSAGDNALKSAAQQAEDKLNAELNNPGKDK